MKYSIQRLDLRIVREFSNPVFELPMKASQIFKGLFTALSPRFSLRMEDLQSYGGISYADVKLVVVAFSGAGRVELSANSLALQFVNLIRTTDDLRVVQDFVSTIEKTVEHLLPDNRLAARGIKGSAWIACDGGLAAVDNMLRERGDLALNLNTGVYAEYEKRYSIAVTLVGRNGFSINFRVERSELEDSHLYVDAAALYRQDEVSSFDEQFEDARMHFRGMLSHLGLEEAK